MPLLWRAHDHHRNLRSLVPASRAAIAATAYPGDEAMIRHGLPRTMVARNAPWPQGALTSAVLSGPQMLRYTAEYANIRHLFLPEIIALTALTSMPGNPHLSPETTPNLFYP